MARLLLILMLSGCGRLEYTPQVITWEGTYDVTLTQNLIDCGTREAYAPISGEATLIFTSTGLTLDGCKVEAIGDLDREVQVASCPTGEGGSVITEGQVTVDADEVHGTIKATVIEDSYCYHATIVFDGERVQ